MDQLGFQQTFSDAAGNAIGVMGNGERQIILLGHIDTVPGEIQVRIDNDLLYGRGAVDAKGPLAAFVQAVGQIGAIPGWELVVIGAVDEERDSVGVRHIINRYRPNYAVIGEPSGWDRCTLGYKGSARSTITVRRPQAHSAHQDLNACEEAFEIWLSIRKFVSNFNTHQKKLFDQLMVSLIEFHSGSSQFEDWAEITVAARLPLSLSPSNWNGELERIVHGEQIQPSGFPIAAYRVEKNTPLVRAFLSSIRQLSGKPRFVNKTGTADMNIVGPAWSCPMLAYGPGDSMLDHTPNEHISIIEYLNSIKVLQGAIQTITEGSVESS
jgi:LysW-gamma-L-lysine carboxypeptidase